MRKTRLNLFGKFKVDFENLPKLENSELNVRTTNLLSEEVVDKIIEKITAKKQCTEQDASILIAGIMQRGGSNQNAKSTTFTYEQYTLNAKELQGYIDSVQKKATTRQLARSLASEIAEVGIFMGLEGDLANQMRFEQPNLSDIDAAWCSNFQTTNPDCPANVREWLVQNYRSRFNK